MLQLNLLLQLRHVHQECIYFARPLRQHLVTQFPTEYFFLLHHALFEPLVAHAAPASKEKSDFSATEHIRSVRCNAVLAGLEPTVYVPLRHGGSKKSLVVTFIKELVQEGTLMVHCLFKLLDIFLLCLDGSCSLRNLVKSPSSILLVILLVLAHIAMPQFSVLVD